jgi:hypothetical protein
VTAVVINSSNRVKILRDPPKEPFITTSKNSQITDGRNPDRTASRDRGTQLMRSDCDCPNAFFSQHAKGVFEERCDDMDQRLRSA